VLWHRSERVPVAVKASGASVLYDSSRCSSDNTPTRWERDRTGRLLRISNQAILYDEFDGPLREVVHLFGADPKERLPTELCDTLEPRLLPRKKFARVLPVQKFIQRKVRPPGVAKIPVRFHHFQRYFFPIFQLNEAGKNLGPVDGRGHAMFGWPMEEQAKPGFTITVNWRRGDSSIATRNWGRWTAALAARPKIQGGLG
jgi:hypothetical protein